MVQVPKPTTLKRYGLSLDEWKTIRDRQGGVCAVCHILPKSNRLCIDHFHAPGWKKMAPEQRKRYVRGLLCWRCNTTFVGRGINLDRARNVVGYLKDYRDRFNGLRE